MLTTEQPRPPRQTANSDRSNRATPTGHCPPGPLRPGRWCSAPGRWDSALDPPHPETSCLRGPGVLGCARPPLAPAQAEPRWLRPCFQQRPGNQTARAHSGGPGELRPASLRPGHSGAAPAGGRPVRRQSRCCLGAGDAGAHAAGAQVTGQGLCGQGGHGLTAGPAANVATTAALSDGRRTTCPPPPDFPKGSRLLGAWLTQTGGSGARPRAGGHSFSLLTSERKGERDTSVMREKHGSLPPARPTLGMQPATRPGP